MLDIKSRVESYCSNLKINMMSEKKKHPYIFNSWRSILYTEKEKKAGVSEEWKDFRIFYNDVIGSYGPNLRLSRINKNEKFSINNFIWLSDDQLYLLKGSSIIINIDGESKTIKEWSAYSGRTIASIKNRYYKHKDYSSREIVYGRMSKSAKKITDISKSSNVRAKVSKMCSSYRTKDLKKGLEYNLNIDWFLENISNMKCFYCGCSDNIGCDRIDNSVGHTITNVVPCCYMCNVVRNNLFSVEEMKVIGATIREIKNKRKLLYNGNVKFTEYNHR